MACDFSVQDHGSLFIVTPMTPAARDFSAGAFAHAQTWASGYVVEHRFIEPIVDDLIAQGFGVQGIRRQRA